MEHLIRAQNGEGDGNPLQRSCVENSTDRGAWWATVHRVTKNWKLPSNWAKLIAVTVISNFKRKYYSRCYFSIFMTTFTIRLQWRYWLSDPNGFKNYIFQLMANNCVNNGKRLSSNTHGVLLSLPPTLLTFISVSTPAPGLSVSGKTVLPWIYCSTII